MVTLANKVVQVYRHFGNFSLNQQIDRRGWLKKFAFSPYQKRKRETFAGRFGKLVLPMQCGCILEKEKLETEGWKKAARKYSCIFKKDANCKTI